MTSSFTFKALAFSVVATTLLSGAVQSSESKLSSFLTAKYSQNSNIKDLRVNIVDSRVIPNSRGWKGVKLNFLESLISKVHLPLFLKIRYFLPMVKTSQTL